MKLKPQLTSITNLSIQNITFPCLFSSSLQKVNIIMHQSQQSNRGKQQFGQFYRFEKSYFYKERLVVLYLLEMVVNNTLSKEGSQTVRMENHIISILDIFNRSIVSFDKSMQRRTLERCSHENNESEMEKLQLCKQKLKKLLCNVLSTESIGYNKISLEQTQSFLDILLCKWIAKQNMTTQLFDNIEKVFGEKLHIQHQCNKQKIIRLTVIEQVQAKGKQFESKRKQTLVKGKQSKHLLYKRIVIKIGEQKIIEIIETNQQKCVFFRFTELEKFQTQSSIELIQTRSKIKDLFSQKDCKKVLQSEGENSDSESDNKSQIVMDDEFYRISSKISSSMRKNSFNSVEKIPQEKQMSDHFLYDSIVPDLISENKMYNPLSEIYTRSSSLEKGNLTFKDNMSTSIDLLMKLELDSINYRRKKSCENTRTCQKSVQKSKAQQEDKRVCSNLKINFYNEERANFYQGQFQGNQFMAKGDDGLKEFAFESEGRFVGSNHRLGIARSFFRQNMCKD